jgi:protocatechuate 3,4-dioxygenase, beta subunit
MMQWNATLILFGLLLGLIGSEAPGQAPRSGVSSGLAPGETVEPWRPIHVAGPDRGTTACPICTYLEKPAVVVFTRDGENAVELARRVEALVAANGDKGLKGFVVVLDSTPERLAKTARRAGVSRSALCYPDPASREEDLQAYKINPAATSTVLVYKDYTVAARFVDLSAKDFGRVEAATAKLVR